ncbi:MAG: helix-turn-helix domain-containing protein [Thermincola sp.]|nr:helix-turn-helix domain-containing protein [Thermincola sp.]
MFTQKLGPLLNYDPQKSKMYIETLEVYLRSGNSLQETAQTCNVHLGTVKYRLRRIREILDVDFNEAETVFNLQVGIAGQAINCKLC